MIVKLAQKTKHAIIKHKVISVLMLGTFYLFANLELIYLVPGLAQDLPEIMAQLGGIFIISAMFSSINHPVAQNVFMGLSIGTAIISILIKLASFII